MDLLPSKIVNEELWKANEMFLEEEIEADIEKARIEVYEMEKVG